MTPIVFFVAAIIALGGAVGVVVLRNPFYATLSLAAHLVGLAVLFLLLNAEFVAAAQVVVYAGAVIVLYIFVVAYVGSTAASLSPPAGPGLRALSMLFAGALAVELFVAVLGTGLKAVDSEGADVALGFGSPGALGELLLTRFLLPFELATVLLMMTAVGAVVLARRRGGIEAAGTVTPAAPIPATLPPGVGSMKEGVGDINPVAEIGRLVPPAEAAALPASADEQSTEQEEQR